MEEVPEQLPVLPEDPPLEEEIPIDGPGEPAAPAQAPQAPIKPPVEEVPDPPEVLFVTLHFDLASGWNPMNEQARLTSYNKGQNVATYSIPHFPERPPASSITLPVIYSTTTMFVMQSQTLEITIKSLRT